MIAAAIASRHPVVICDEHQDSSGDQHAVVMQLLAEGARVRIFADTMQRIFPEKANHDSYPPIDWERLNQRAHAWEALDFPHRWNKGCTQLGNWTLKARESLRQGKQVDLTASLPPSVSVVYSENRAAKHQQYQWEKHARHPIAQFQQAHASLMVLTRHNDTARSLSALFGRQLPIWEGHTRYGLEMLVKRIGTANGDPSRLASAIVAFMADVGKGFSPSQFGNRFEQEVADRCAKAATGKPKKLQGMAQMLLDSPDHRGVARVLKLIAALSHADDQFREIEIDCKREFWDGARLGGFDTPDVGLAELASRRSHARPKPPKRAISNIYKAKGLECDAVLLMPCDKHTFPDKHDARCLLYVALSRATRHLMLVVSRDNPSPLLKVV
jgi:DNA helicase-2/ATP-dependent DNA helicase PcrA